MISKNPGLKRKGVLALLILALLLGLTGPAAARNPDLSDWTRNLSGDEPAGENWMDHKQEIEVVENTVHVTYWATWQSQYRLYYRRSIDGGQTWEAKILLYETTYSVSGDPMALGWKFLAVDGDRVHVAYAHSHGTNCELMYRRSLDKGATFEAARPLAPSEGSYWWINTIHIAANDSKVTIACQYQPGDAPWIYRYVAALNSTDGGETFTRTEVADSGNRYLGASVVDLKRVGNQIYILYVRDLATVWYGIWNSPLYCAVSQDGGVTFPYHTQISTAAAAPDGRYYSYLYWGRWSYAPNLAVDGDNVYVVWTQNDTNKDSNDISLYLRRSTDQGLNFGEPQKLATNQTGGLGNLSVNQEAVAAQGGHVYVVFQTTDGAVYLRRSTDSGANFFPWQTMGAGGRAPNLVVDPGTGAKVHVFWGYYTYRYSSDSGASFTNPVVIMPFESAFTNRTGIQMALGPGDSRHFTMPLTYIFTEQLEDIFYRCVTAAPAPSGNVRALKTYSDSAQKRYDCMEVASTDWLNFAAQMSGEVWVKPSAGGVDNGMNNHRKDIFCKMLNGTVPNQLDLNYTLGTTGEAGETKRQAVAEINTADGWFSLRAEGLTPFELIPDDTWTHLAFTYDAGAAGNNFKLYKNGRIIASMRATGNLKTGPGNLYAGYYGRWELQELRLWNRALTQTEIYRNAHRQLTGFEDGLNAYYQFSDTTKDMTGHGNDGILIYQESFISPPPLPWWPTPAPINTLLLD
jgi:hypothetical protein